MADCLSAIGIGIRSAKRAASSVLPLSIALISLISLTSFTPTPARAQMLDTLPDGQCNQAWPVSCDTAGGGDTGCGGWTVVTDLAEAESFPAVPAGLGSGLKQSIPATGSHCSTGVRLALPNGLDTQGQPVGSMFKGFVIFSQDGRARDGRDYGGVVVIKLELDDGSPQCYLRYMFLDRRDMVGIGKTLRPGERVGSVASNSMSPTRNWWAENWPGWQPQVKIDIGCDEALSNLPHFIPMEAIIQGSPPEDPNNCPLTKLRFPARPLEYLANTEHGSNPVCSVGIRKDMRPKLVEAKSMDVSEKNLQADSHWVTGVKPRGVIKRKSTPVFALFGDPDLRQTLFDANPHVGAGTSSFRYHTAYRNATDLHCQNMTDLFRGKRGLLFQREPLTPDEVREYLTHCTNQVILGRAMFTKVLESTATLWSGSMALRGVDAATTPIRDNVLLSPIPSYMLNFLHPLVRIKYAMLVNGTWDGNEDGTPDYPNGATRRQVVNEMTDQVRNVAWRDQCQPLRMEMPSGEDFVVTDLLHKAWKELLIEWPTDNDLEPINREIIPPVHSVDYAEYPYERIVDPSSPFSPRHIWSETERERYSNYGVQCASTPVDIILSAYWDRDNKDSPDGMKIFGNRDIPFHQCTSCRIELNEKQMCFADPYSFENPGGCQAATSPVTNGGGCDDMDPRLRLLMQDAASRYGINIKLVMSTAKHESGCGSGGHGQCIHQHEPGAHGELIQCEHGAANLRGHAMGIFQIELGCVGLRNCGNQCARVSSLNAGQCNIPDPQTDICMNMRGAGDQDFNICDPAQNITHAVQLMARLAAANNCDMHDTAARYNGSGSRAEEYGDWMVNDTGDTNACAPGGPFPDGNGTAVLTTTPSGPAGPTGPWGPSPFTPTTTTSITVGNFNPAGCPGNFLSTTNLTAADAAAHHLSDIQGDKACAALSYPLADIVPEGIDSSENINDWYVNFGCWRWWSGTASSNTYTICDHLDPALNGSRWCAGHNCGSGCNGSDCRIHEGVDLMADYGAPVYAAAAGRVAAVSNMQTAIDHSGECVDQACTSRFPEGVITAYLHMGQERTIVSQGDTVTRCQQIGSVGDYGSAGTPHLHFETHDQQNTVTAPILDAAGFNPASSYPERFLWRPYWPFDSSQRFFVHPTDVSCSGGAWDAEGVMGAQGICKYALPVTASGHEDLTPPEYLTEYWDKDAHAYTESSPFSPVEMPNPESEKRGDNFDREVDGMIYDGAWKECTNLSGDNVDFCNFLNSLPGSASNPTPPITGGSGAFINPAPCHPTSSPFGPRSCSVCASDTHYGIDISTPEGTPILAAADGTIEYVDPVWTGVCGPSSTAGDLAGVWIRIGHADGSKTRYLHLKEGSICPEVTVGATVVQGQVIAMSDTTTASCQAHLHFETIINDAAVDPALHIPPAAPDDPQCPTINGLQCGQTATGVPVGSGGGAAKTICIDRPCTLSFNEADATSSCAWPKDVGGCGPMGDRVQNRGDAETPMDCCFNITQPVVGMNVLKTRPGFDREIHAPFWTPENQPTFPRTAVDVHLLGEDTAVVCPKNTVCHNMLNDPWVEDDVRFFNNLMNRSEWMEGAWVGGRLLDEGGLTPLSETNRGAPEGYTFHEFFKNHRPYMRWWDTGAGSGEIYQDIVSTDLEDGWHDALVGVGVEKSNCGYGGWGDPTKLDPNTSWMELKLYQARALSQHALTCIPRYETKVKPMADEDFVLTMAGGTFQSSFHGLGSAGQVDIDFPLGWRGFISEPVAAVRFPYLQTMPQTLTAAPTVNNPPGDAYLVGIDNALPGDIVVWDHEVVGDKRLPHAAYITRANTAAMELPADQRFEVTRKHWIRRPEQGQIVPSITVVEMNHGKYPDVCGGTNWLGIGDVERTIYKGQTPDGIVRGMRRYDVGVTSCANPDLTSCGENEFWDNAKVYRPWRHVRE